MSSKVCTRCNVDKPLDQYSRAKKHKDGLAYYCKECMKELNNSPAAKARQRKWRAANADRLREYRRDKREQIDARRAEWRKENPDKVSEVTLAYRQRRRDARVPGEEVPTLVGLIALHGNTCLWWDCDSTDVQTDHVVPLSRGGSDTYSNTQVLCGSHNSTKATKIADMRFPNSNKFAILDTAVTK